MEAYEAKKDAVRKTQSYGFPDPRKVCTIATFFSSFNTYHAAGVSRPHGSKILQKSSTILKLWPAPTKPGISRMGPFWE